jgi:ribosomal protein S18 acetylase RimI-like enzyme
VSLSRSTAANLAAWHSACLESIGLGSRTTERLWVAVANVPLIFFAAITLGEAPQSEALAGATSEIVRSLAPFHGFISVCDAWNRIDLEPFGFVRSDDHAWMARTPADVAPALLPSGIRIVRLHDESAIDEFEATHNRGFKAPSTRPRTYYGPGLLRNERMHIFLAELDDGTPVGTAMAFVSEDVVGIYSVSVVPAFRRRGIGHALTRAAILAGGERTAVLQASDEGVGMYRSLGFEPFANFAGWLRSGTETPDRI